MMKLRGRKAVNFWQTLEDAYFITLLNLSSGQSTELCKIKLGYAYFSHRSFDCTALMWVKLLMVYMVGQHFCATDCCAQSDERALRVRVKRLGAIDVERSKQWLNSSETWYIKGLMNEGIYEKIERFDEYYCFLSLCANNKLMWLLTPIWLSRRYIELCIHGKPGQINGTPVGVWHELMRD